MKGCFVLQRRYAHVGHEIANALIKEYGLTDACAYVQVRASMDFLQSQRDFRYTSLLLDEDIHRTYSDEIIDLEYLRKLEKEIGNPTLWQYINPDRIIRSSQLVREYPYDAPMYSHDDMLRLVQVYAKKVTEFFDREKPDFIFMTQPGSLGTLLLYYLACKRGIPTKVIIIPGLEGRTCVSDTWVRLTGIDAVLTARKVTEEHIARAKEVIRRFREAPRSYSRVYDSEHVQYTRGQQLAFLTPRGILRLGRWSLHMLRERFTSNRAHTDYSTIQPRHFFIDRIRRKMRNGIGYGDLYDAYDCKKYFAFFPLHLEPELSLSVQAPFASNQLEVIGHIAQSLPVSMLLYVKEHPQMVGYRTRTFYQSLKKIPNVRLLNPTIPGVEVMRDAAIVLTIAGSAGFEAVLFKKPVISFGKLYYNALSSVVHSTTPEELPARIREQLEEFHFNEDELVLFVAAMIQDSANVDFAYLWAFEHDVPKLREGLREFTQIVARTVGLTRM